MLVSEILKINQYKTTTENSFSDNRFGVWYWRLAFFEFANWCLALGVLEFKKKENDMNEKTIDVCGELTVDIDR